MLTGNAISHLLILCIERKSLYNSLSGDVGDDDSGEFTLAWELYQGEQTWIV